MRARTNKVSRRRVIYTQNDRKRWLAIGTLLVTSAAALGYFCGRYREKFKQNGTLKGNDIDYKNNMDKTDKGDIKPLNIKIKYERDYRVLIYGDSTTWGYDPDKQTRLLSNQRYPCVLEKLLNDDPKNQYKVSVISEGLNGRTTIHEDREGNKKNERRQLSMNGLDQLLPILYSHKPIDIIVIMLGINDCKSKFNPSANKIAKNINEIVQQCINAEIWPIDLQNVNHGPQIVLISPASVRELNAINKGWGFSQSSINVSQSLHTQYAKLTTKYDKNVIHFVNANKYIQTGSDSVHIDGENNIKLAFALSPIIKKIIHDLQIKSRKMSIPSFTASSLKHHQEHNKLIDIHLNNNKTEEEEEEDDSLSELEQERNGDIIIKSIEFDNDENIDVNEQCDSNHKSKTT